MGRDKASLPFGTETLLERVVRIVSEVVGEVWVVAREEQGLPAGYRRAPARAAGRAASPPATRQAQVARDPGEGLGPLAGLCAGLEAMNAERAFLTSCDVPLLKPAYVERLLALSSGFPIAVPKVGGHTMVTSAVYAREVLPVAQRLVSERRLRPLFLVEAVEARIVTEQELREVDPDLDSLRDCNTPEAYRAALRDASLV